MDQIKIGQFIADMRKEQGLTQEEFGDKLGVTNKTVSRWETGKYMPDLDKLQELSKLVGVSVNELLSGEKIINPITFIEKADENLIEALSGGSAFGLQDKIAFFKKKWMKDHTGYIALWCTLYSIVIIVAIFMKQPIIWGAAAIIGILIYGCVRNKMMIYVEQNAFGK